MPDGAAAAHCPGCGRPVHACPGCAGPYDAERFCTACGRRLAVQVTPTGWTGRCRACGHTAGSAGPSSPAPTVFGAD